MLSKHYFLIAALGGIVLLGNWSLAAAQTVGPNGEAAIPSSALTLTDAEVAKLREGKYSAALVWHTSSDFISAVTAGATRRVRSSWDQGGGNHRCRVRFGTTAQRCGDGHGEVAERDPCLAA